MTEDQRRSKNRSRARWLAAVVVGLAIGGAFLAGARIGFDRGQAQARLSEHDTRVRQILYAMWSLTDGDEVAARGRLETLLTEYLKDRVAMYDREPFLLARHEDDAFPSREYIPAQLDAMIYDHLSSLYLLFAGRGPRVVSDEAIVTHEVDPAIEAYLAHYNRILTHTAQLYGVALKAPLDDDENVTLHERPDGPVAHHMAYNELYGGSPALTLEFVGEAQVGDGGVLWARYRAPSGETGFVPVNGLNMIPHTPWWRHWLARLPGY